MIDLSGIPDSAWAIIATVVTGALAGIGWMAKSRREDRLRAEAKLAEEQKEAIRLRREERDKYEARIEALQLKVQSLLGDAIAREREYAESMLARADLDNQMRAVFDKVVNMLGDVGTVLRDFMNRRAA